MTEKPSKFFLRGEIAKLVEKNPTLSILDIGSGQSQNFLDLLSRYPKLRYVGIEPSARDAAAARDLLKDFANAEVRAGFANRDSVRDNELFDVVVSLSVLEHIKHLENFLKFSVRHLKPDGTLIHLYDLGHSLHPSSIKERIQVTLSNNPLFRLLLPERKVARYIDSEEVKSILADLNVDLRKTTYHNNPGLVSVVRNLSESAADVETMKRIVSMELVFAPQIMNRKIRERLFPSVCLWGHKKV